MLIRLLLALRNSAACFTSFAWCTEARFKGFEIKGTVRFLGRPVLSCASGALVEIADGVRVHSSLRSNPITCSSPCVLRAMGPGSLLRIGPRVGMSASIIVAAKRVEIGPDTLIGSGVLIADNDFHSPGIDGVWRGLDYNSAKPVVIGSRVFIGTRAIILKGVTIGDDCVIGAGSVVTKSIPPSSIVFGNPAVYRPRK